MKALAAISRNGVYRRTRSAEGAGIPLPREHGAWIMLLTCLALGTAVARGATLATLPFAASALFAFALREPLYLITGERDDSERRRSGKWALGFGALSAISGIIGVTAYGQWLLLPLGGYAGLGLLVSVHLRKRRAGRTVAAELGDLALVTAAAPGAYYASASSDWNLATFALLWWMTYLYYGGSVFYVKLKATQATIKPAGIARRLVLGWKALGYQGIALALAYAIGRALGGPDWVYLALVPNSLKVLAGTVMVPRKVNFMKIGYAEVLFATLFAVILGAMLRA